jgi:hypothetical protein
MKSKLTLLALVFVICAFSGCGDMSPYVLNLHTDATLPGGGFPYLHIRMLPPAPGATGFFIHIVKTASDGTPQSIIYENYFNAPTPEMDIPLTMLPPTGAETSYIQIVGSYSYTTPEGLTTYGFLTQAPLAGPGGPPQPQPPYNYQLNKQDGTPGVTINSMGLMP